MWHGSHWATVKVSAGLDSFLEALREGPFPFLFLASSGCTQVLAQGLLHTSSKPATFGWVLFILWSLFLSCLPPSSTIKKPCDCIGPTWVTQTNLLFSKSWPINNLNSICNLNSPLLCNVTKFTGMVSLGAVTLPTAEGMKSLWKSNHIYPLSSWRQNLMWAPLLSF